MFLSAKVVNLDVMCLFNIRIKSFILKKGYRYFVIFIFICIFAQKWRKDEKENRYSIWGRR